MSRSSRVWVISELFYPEETSTGYYLTRIAEALAETNNVHVLCAQPNYAARGQRAESLESYKDMTIRRVWSTRWSKDKLFLRLVNMLTLTFSLFWQAIFRVRRGDRILVVTNPPIMPFGIQLAARMRGARFVLLIHDVYPDVLAATGHLQKRCWRYRLLQRMFNRFLRRCDDLIVLGRDMRQLIASKLPSEAAPRLHAIPNWADRVPPPLHHASHAKEPQDTKVDNQTLQLSPPTVSAGRLSTSRESSLREQWNLAEAFVVLHTGNMGRTHNLEAILYAAQTLETSHPNIKFVFVGEGARRGWLDQQTQLLKLSNVCVYDRVPREKLPELHAVGDIAVVSFIPNMQGVSVPSRLYNLLAAGLPVAAVTDKSSEMARVVVEEQAGWVVEDQHPQHLAAVIKKAATLPPPQLLQFKERAIHAALTRFSYQRVAEAYRQLFDTTNCKSQFDRRTEIDLLTKNSETFESTDKEAA